MTTKSKEATAIVSRLRQAYGHLIRARGKVIDDNALVEDIDKAIEALNERLSSWSIAERLWTNQK